MRPSRSPIAPSAEVPVNLGPLGSTSNPLSLVVVGDAESGKSSLLKAMLGQPSPLLHESTSNSASDNMDIEVNGKTFSMKLADTTARTGGRMDMGWSRRAALKNANVVLICLNVSSVKRNRILTETLWMPEAKRASPSATVILVGTQTDVREDPTSQKMLSDKGLPGPYSKAEGELLARKIGAKYYHETSAVSKEGIQELVELAKREALNFVTA